MGKVMHFHPENLTLFILSVVVDFTGGCHRTNQSLGCKQLIEPH